MACYLELTGTKFPIQEIKGYQSKTDSLVLHKSTYEVVDLSAISELSELNHLEIDSINYLSLDFLLKLPNLDDLIITPAVPFDRSALIILSKLAKKTQITICHELINQQALTINYQKINISSFSICCRDKQQLLQQNYKRRLKKAISIIAQLLIKNKIKYFWNRFLEARKDSISRYCFLANHL